MAVIPHKPTPPTPPQVAPCSLQSRPVVFLSPEEQKKLADPCVDFGDKTKILFDNWEANHPKEPDKGPSGGGGLSPYAAAMMVYQCGMDHFAIESKIWSEECSKDESFRAKLESICVAEKKKSESGHYKAPEGRGR